MPYLLHGRHCAPPQRPPGAEAPVASHHTQRNVHAAKDQRRHFEEGLAVLQPRPRLLTYAPAGGVRRLHTRGSGDNGVTTGQRSVRILLLYK